VSTAARIAQGSGEKLTLGKMDIYRDWGWAPDYVDAMWRILQHNQPEDFVIATGKERSLGDFVDRVFAELGLESGRHVESDASLFRPSDIERSCGNAAKAKETLGWKADHAFEDIIRLLVRAEMDR
jgi:GDPmannose 4,6-dehydratase